MVQKIRKSESNGKHVTVIGLFRFVIDAASLDTVTQYLPTLNLDNFLIFKLKFLLQKIPSYFDCKI